MMRTVRIALLLAAFTVSAFFAGCGGAGKSANSAADKENGPSPGANEPVELTVYSAGGTDRNEFEQNYGSFIRKKFPHITLNYINPREGEGFSFTNLILAGVNVDLYYESIGTFFMSLQTNKSQFDLTDLIKKHGVDLNRFEPTLIEALKQNGNGQIWGLPVTTNSMSL
jgi:multiple sugar transport system substrate-binding protein